MGNQQGGAPKNEAVARRLAEYKKARKQKGAGVAVLKLDSCSLTDVDLDAVSPPPQGIYSYSLGHGAQRRVRVRQNR
jgi:hypothetical protein